MLIPLTLFTLLSVVHQLPVSVQSEGQRIVVDSGRIKLTVDERTGRYDISVKDRVSVQDIDGEVGVADGRTIKTSEYSHHEVGSKDIRRVKDAFGSGVRITEHHRGTGGIELRNEFWVYANRPEVFVRLDGIGANSIASNYLAPIVTDSPLHFTHKNPLQALFVPYDNDSYFRYRSDGWGEGEGDGDGSYEVSALYDDGTRNGLVVGSLDHETWKSAVHFTRDSKGNAASLRAFAGVTSKYTHDTQPHGTVSGREIQSPRMVIGWYDDWRVGMERYGDLNALVKPALTWNGSAPFGWSSWSGHKATLKASDAREATDFIKNDLSWFRNDGTAYINLDSYWDNLSHAQLVEFVKHAHAGGLKTGIYWSPFVCWGKLTDRVAGDTRTYGDLALRDAKGQPLPRLDGGYPLDPTNAGTIARIDRELGNFVSLGFDLLKLDFMTHGSIEGKHANSKITTGAAAYAYGMRRIDEDLSPKRAGRPIFICLSIAPMFPSGYGHSRRISCDIFSNIGATEYFLNSANYGWWTSRRLYRFNDPDSTCVYQALGEPPVTEAEARSRFTSSVIGGGMMIEGDNLTKPDSRQRVKEIYSNRELLELAKKSPSFRPVFGDTGYQAGHMFVWIQPDRKSAYVAFFNFDKKRSLDQKVSLERLGLPSVHSALVHNLWSGTNARIASDLQFHALPMDCEIVRLSFP